jgi:phage terminase small subunit
MPNPADHPNVDPSKKTKGRKHRTLAEIDRRKQAADALSRAKSVTLKPPAWLNKEAKAIWQRKIKEIKGLNSPDTLLDTLDGDVLAVFCDNLASYSGLAKKNGKTTLDEHKIKQTYSLRIIGAAERLGFTPASRARLIKKTASGIDEDQFGNEFD